MIITNITEQNMQAFEPLAPQDMLEALADEAHFALGAVQEEEDGQPGYAVGILLYDLVEDEETSYVQLNWLYVAQDYRRMGAGNALMEKFYDILNTAQIAGTLCEVPASLDNELLCAFLESWDFSFTYQKKYELTLSLEEILEYPFFEETIDLTGVKPLQVLSQSQVRNRLKQFSGTDPQAEQVLQPEEWELVDHDISCGVMETGELRGLFLIQQRSGVLETVCLLGSRERKNDIFAMLQFAAVQAFLKYPLETTVHIMCRSDASAALVEALFPDQEPLVVRHGEVTPKSEKEEAMAELTTLMAQLQRLEENVNGQGK